MMSWTSLLLCLALMMALSAAQEPERYSIDAAKSKLEVNVYREGVLKFLGHDHVIAAKNLSGSVQLDKANVERSTVRLKVDAPSLTVVDSGVDEKERRDVQTTMASDRVLDVARYPEITFTSTNISQVKANGDGYELTLTGELTVHGVTKKISIPVRVRVAGNELRAQGEVSLLQTDYQIKPVRVGGGMVKVKDKVKITFDLVALK